MVAPALIWGARIALPAIARVGGPLLARAGAGLRGALGFAAKRPVTTLVGAELATGGAVSDAVLPDMPNMGEMASGVGNWLTGTTTGNLAMGAGGLWLASRLFGGGGGGGGGIGGLGTLLTVGAAVGPLLAAENGIPRAMGAMQSVFQGITAGATTGDWSQLQSGFSQLGGLYGEGFGNIGNRLGLTDGQPTAGATPARIAGENGVPHVEWNGSELVAPGAPDAGNAATGPNMAAGDADLAAGENLIAGVEDAEAAAAERRASIGDMRRTARHGG